MHRRSFVRSFIHVCTFCAYTSANLRETAFIILAPRSGENARATLRRLTSYRARDIFGPREARDINFMRRFCASRAFCVRIRGDVNPSEIIQTGKFSILLVQLKRKLSAAISRERQIVTSSTSLSSIYSRLRHIRCDHGDISMRFEILISD